MKLPTKKEINVFDTLDERVACDHFYKKTLAEAEALFRENSLYYQEDLLWMGIKAFKFYLPSVINYLQSEYAAKDSDLINFLHEIIDFRSSEAGFSEALDSVNSLIDYVLANYEKFEVDSAIYGNLHDKYQDLQNQLKKRAA